MRRIILAATSLLAFYGASPATAGVVTGLELEHARANARAGGPLSERDRELLERWGCLSGTEHPFCARLEGRGSYAKKRRHRRHR